MDRNDSVVKGAIRSGNHDGADALPESDKGKKHALDLLFPPDLAVWQEARRLVSDKNVRVESLAVCSSQDPVIVLELLRVSNAMYFSAGRAPITATKTAIVRLGSDLVLEQLKKVGERPQFKNDDVRHWFEVHRNRCKRTAIIARMLSETVSKKLDDDCHSAALLLYIGEMLAVANLGESYVKLAEELSRSAIKYRLAQDHNFNCEEMGVKYLHRHGIPDVLLAAIDHDGQARTPDRMIMKPIVWGAGELVDAFDSNRWEKFAPGKTLPAKSPLRLLQINDSQYLKLYERASEYLFSSRLLEEQRRKEALTGSLSQPNETENLPSLDDNSTLQSEISSLMEDAPSFQEQAPTKSTVGSITSAPFQTTTSIPTTQSLSEQFSIKTADQPKKNIARTEQTTVVAAPQLRTNAGQQLLNTITETLNSAKSSEELLMQIMTMLVDKGPFKKSALIVVSKDRQQALVVCSRGGIGNGQRLTLDDPLSPLAQCFSKVQSFGNRESKNSPFGSKAYALAPIDADHDTPVALYADCGNDGALSFESRRVFRTAVEILNKKLPSLPGGIPVELQNQ